MPSLEVNGSSLEYAEHGSGESVVLVHGSASDLRTWQRQQEAFGERFRAIAYSRRYHWPNARISEGSEYPMAEQVDDLEAVLRSLDAAPAHLVGHSYGGYVCLLLAARAPDLVRSLVLVEPPVMSLLVSMPPRPLEILGLALRSPRTAIEIMKLGALGLGPGTAAFKRGDTEAAMRFIGTAILGRESFRNLSQARAEQIRDNLFKEEFLAPGAALPPLKEEQVRSVRAPALFVCGSRSPRLFACLTDQLQRLLPASERTDVPDASHIVHEDNAPAYNRAVLSFLAKHQASSSST